MNTQWCFTNILRQESLRSGRSRASKSTLGYIIKYLTRYCTLHSKMVLNTEQLVFPLLLKIIGISSLSMQSDYLDLLIVISFSIPCVWIRERAFSELSVTISWMVLSTATTVSSSKFLAGRCCPPGKFRTN